MSGLPVTRRGREIFGARKTQSPRDKCDIDVTVDLIGVRREAAVKVKGGDILEVALRAVGSLASAVCITVEGDVVGALAAFPGIAQLIGCLESGVAYRAMVEVSSPTRCQVTVSRVDR